MANRPAVLGGPPAIDRPFAPYSAMGAEELAAVQSVVSSGCLSGFYGSWGDEFFGGPQVRAFEAAWKKRFDTAFCISVNSATSGLFAAVGAAGVGPADEVIVPPYTMSATAVAPLVYGAIPVFADIEKETYCLTPESVAAVTGERTRAVIAVNLFGHPARLAELRQFCDDRGLILIEDNAQGPLAMENGRYAGTVGHIGVFSLNYHKHLHTGEGGMCTTDDENLARRIQLIRNHGENCVAELQIKDMANLFGFNYRMTELSAAVGRVQLSNIDTHVERRRRWADQLTRAVSDLPGLFTPTVRTGCKHVYYVWACRLSAERAGFSRKVLISSMAAEGVPLCAGYVQPLYLLPLFQNRIAMGGKGFPFSLTERTYEAGLCPVCEKMHDEELFFFEMCMYALDDGIVEKIGAAFHKIWEHRDALQEAL